MNRENTRGPLTRAAAAALGVLAMLASVLTLTAAPAQAADEGYGYAKVQSPEPYLAVLAANNIKILHVDTEHATPDGFWFAERNGISNRGFGWIYQSYGMSCESPAADVEFNPWMNSYGCLVDGEKMAANGGPAWASNTAACVERTGYPWKTGSMFASDSCADTVLDRASTTPLLGSSTRYICAPWEDQGFADGMSKCVQTTYPWADGPANTFWMPAPDTCTQMPANSNKVTPYHKPSDYAPVTGGDGSCTGEALAPNCPANSTHEACTGVPYVPPTPTDPTDTVQATATRSVTVTGVSATITISQTSTQRIKRVTIKRSATKFYGGKRFKASALRSIYKSATRTASRAVTVSDGSATRSATMSCAAETAEAAQACAADKATAEATRLATEAAQEAASGRATAAATAQAQAASVVAARAAAQAAHVVAAEKRKTARTAKVTAVKKVNRQIRQFKNR